MWTGRLNNTVQLKLVTAVSNDDELEFEERSLNATNESEQADILFSSEDEHKSEGAHSEKPQCYSIQILKMMEILGVTSQRGKTSTKGFHILPAWNSNILQHNV